MEIPNAQEIARVQNAIVALQSIMPRLAAIQAERQAYMANLSTVLSALSLGIATLTLSFQNHRTEQLQDVIANLQAEVDRLKREKHELGKENFWFRVDTYPYDWPNDSMYPGFSKN